MLRAHLFCLAGAAILLSACNTASERAPAIGEAYAGPPSLALHQDIDLKSPVVVTVHHGDKLEIVGQRRRWYKVRAGQGAEGWTSDRELLDTAQMERLRGLAEETAGLPSQGVATTFSAVNVHTEPNRLSTSFVQVNEHETFDVIAHRLAPRIPLPRRQLIPPKPKVEVKKAKDRGKDQKGSAVEPPPLPVPPDPPTDWIGLSKELDAPGPDVDVPPAPTVPTDDWTLIRTANGVGGWVLTSSLYLKIPDEVAQYAEGHRITSYFSVGKIRDGEQVKDIWLWTTSEKLGEPVDFDGYRVFTWSLRHHRYETAYIQRHEQGFFPVIAKEGEFSVCLTAKDGSMVRKQYTMMGNAVRLAGEQPCGKVGVVSEDTPGEQALLKPGVVVPALAKSFAQRAKDRLKALFVRK
jgi:hypothetical protein